MAVLFFCLFKKRNIQWICTQLSVEISLNFFLNTKNLLRWEPQWARKIEKSGENLEENKN